MGFFKRLFSRRSSEAIPAESASATIEKLVLILHLITLRIILVKILINLIVNSRFCHCCTIVQFKYWILAIIQNICLGCTYAVYCLFRRMLENYWR